MTYQSNTGQKRRQEEEKAKVELGSEAGDLAYFAHPLMTSRIIRTDES